MPEVFIGLKRIIAVDSARFAYAELDIDEHSILLAKGNVGKSSIINAIRLFLLPECTLRNQKKHFAFSSRPGHLYSSEATFSYYFPSKYSFLILEYEKSLLGSKSCCQILSATGTHLKFERMFTSLPYDQLRSFFWDASRDPDNIGRRKDDLSKDSLYSFIKNNDKNYELVREPEKAARMLYENDLFKAKYTVFPLKNTEHQTIESLRSVIMLLLMGAKDDANFSSAIANIIEAQKKDANSELSFNISQFQERHQELKRQTNLVNLLVQNKGKYKESEELREAFTRKLNQLKQFIGCLRFLKNQKNALSQTLSNKVGLIKELNSQFNIKREQLRCAQEALTSNETLSKDAQKKLKVVDKQLERMSDLQGEFHGNPIKVIQDFLNDDRISNENSLALLNGEANTADEKRRLEESLSNLLGQLERIKSSREKQEFTLQNQLSTEVTSVLHSINPNMVVANPGKALSSYEYEVFESFANQFSHGKCDYTLYDTVFTKGELVPIDFEARIKLLELKVSGVRQELAQLAREYSNPLNKQKDIQDKGKKLARLKEDINALENAEYNAKQKAELTQDIEHYHTLKKSLDTELILANEAFNETERKLNAAKEDKDATQLSIRNIVELQGRFNRARSEVDIWLKLVNEGAIELPNDVTDESLDVFRANVRHLSEYQHQLTLKLRDFIDSKVIDDEHGVKGEPTWTEITATLDVIKQIYGNLQSRQTLLNKQVAEHNKTISNKKKILSYNYSMIKSFEKDINSAFAAITINDIAQIEYSVGIDSLFANLVKDLETEELFTGNMVSDDFYKRLMAFAEKFFGNGESFMLTMDKIVKSLRPKVRPTNESAVTDTEQSNSTIALINIKLVQILLKQLISVSCKTSYPILFDEVANVDISQFSWWLDDININGFKLLAAGTHSTSSEVIDIIGSYHVMDAMTTSHPYHSGRTRVYWAGAEKFTDIQNNLTSGAEQTTIELPE